VSTTTGASIYYTTNGSTPTTSSTPYTGPITVGTNTTINAIATSTGHVSSAVATATYTITPPAAVPTFSPAAGTYTSAQAVSLASTTAGASIYYTSNGSTPTTSSIAYTGPITVSSNTTIKAIAIANGYVTSPVATATYTITPPAAAPSFGPPAGTYTSTQKVSLSSSTTGASIYYTTNGSTPTTGSTKYSGPLTVSASMTINAIAVAAGFASSPVATATYTINPAAPFTLTTSPSTWTVQQNGGVTEVITVTPQNGFAGSVTLSISGLPTGVSSVFLGNEVLMFPALTTPLGTYIVTITGTSGTATAITTVTLIITPAASFSLVPASTSLGLPRGSSATDAIAIVPLNGFTDSVSFVASGLPGGCTSQFSPTSSTSGSTMSVACGAATVTGVYQITITGSAAATGNSSAFPESTSVTLTVD
jgi:hypothetical protein